MPFWYQNQEVTGTITAFSSWSMSVTLLLDDSTQIELFFPGRRETIHFMRWVLVDKSGEDKPDSDVLGYRVTMYYDKNYRITNFS